MRRERPNQREAAHVAVRDRTRAVHADVRPAHPRHLVKRRPALLVRVRVSPRVEQRRRDLKMTVQHRHHQSAGAIGGGLVHAGAGRQQRARSLEVSGADGKQERRKSTFRTRADVGAGPDERFDRRPAASGGRPHERGLPLPLFGRVHVRTAREQDLDDVGAAAPRRGHERRFALRTRGVGIRAGRQQLADERRIAGRGRQGQRADAVAVRGLCIRA